jgi:hypothetical protein
MTQINVGDISSMDDNPFDPKLTERGWIQGIKS